MSSRSYLSIGDVLTLLRQEFPDVTISKIRFLESQGLVNPERTPSGYRKFYEHDVERLRWVLRQQREHFLPLRVIKDRLDEDGSGAASVEVRTAVTETATVRRPVPAATVVAVPPTADAAEEVAVLVGSGRTEVEASPSSVAGVSGVDTATRRRAPARAAVKTSTSSTSGPSTSGPVATVTPVEHAHRAVLATGPAPSSVISADPDLTNGTGGVVAVHGPAGDAGGSEPTDPAEPAARMPPKSTTRRAAAPHPAPATTAGVHPAPGGGNVDPPAGTAGAAGLVDRAGASLTIDDLCTASGLTAEAVAQLQEYSLLSATVVAGVEFFDEEAVAVAELAAGFAAFGIEARHLRLYRNAADREAGFIEQIVIPLVRQRNPEARARATKTAEELSHMGQRLKASLLRTALRDIL